MNVFTKLTSRYLTANKTRTIVTIIGIILSAAMITGVTASVTSLRNYLIELTKVDSGDWHGAVHNLPSSQVEQLESNESVYSYAYIQNLGYARIEDPDNDYKPYIFIGGMSDGLTSHLPVNVIEGRLPENPGEIILPRHLATNGGYHRNLGDTLALDMGYRTVDDEKLWQISGYFHENDGNPEEFIVSASQEFVVVGFYERPTFESFSAAGYTALTVSAEGDYSGDVYIRLNNPRDIYTFLEDEFQDMVYTTNRDLLMYSGISNDSNFTAVMNSLSAILIVLIVFGSISLIYNAFKISINERTKQFGLLSSIGATRKQLRNTVLTEALILSIIGIPLGILAGICGMALTFAFTRNLFSLFISGSSIMMKLSLSPLALAVSAAIGLLTVLVSAYIPVKRALRISTIDAIRQTKDIRIKARKVRTSKLTYKLFGFEAMLARKSFKRSSGQYRATVISLFLSVVLFISASSFYSYLTASAEDILSKAEYDIILRYDREMASHISLDNLYSKLYGLQGIEKSLHLRTIYTNTVLPRNILKPEFIDYMYNQQPGDVSLGIQLNFISDSAYISLLQENGLSETDYMNASSPLALAFDFNRIYDIGDGRYHTFNILKEETFEITLKTAKQIDGFIADDSYIEEDGSTVYIFVNSNGDKIEVPESEFWSEISVRAGSTLKDLPYFMDAMSGGLTLLYPYSAMVSVLGPGTGDMDTELLFKATDHRVLYETIYKALDESNLPSANLYNLAASMESGRALVKVIRIFAYGFIILISLIATANVFNTISTNIRLRTREFAVLRSVGLDKKGLNRIMNFECIFYGIRSLIYGLPVAIGLSYLIYMALSSGWQTSYIFPTMAVIIASGSVFAVVFLTMMYSMRKIKQTNTVEALRNENL